jgi:hypothetical protein
MVGAAIAVVTLVYLVAIAVRRSGVLPAQPARGAPSSERAPALTAPL